MTLKRETKTKVQMARTGTWRIRSCSPRQLAAFGKWLPLEVGQKFQAHCVRGNRTHNRTRASVVESKVAARRRAGRASYLIA